MKKSIGFSLLMIIASCSHPKAQNANSLLHSNDSILSYSDSLSIFQLIDSLLTLEENEIGSQLATRVTYNSNVLSAGRTLGIEQFGLAPGIAYYHSSGLYADASAFWSHDFEPSYYLTILSAGYMHSFSKVFTLMASYDRYLYNNDVDDAYIPYRNTVTVSPFIDIKHFTFRSDYSFYFGDQKAHRIMPSVCYSLEKKKFLKIDKVAFSPAVYLLFGNETLIEDEFIFPETRAERLRNYMLYGTPYQIIEVEKKVFGLMNYAFSFPLYVWHKNWTFNFSYTYSIPRALNDEPLLLEENSFLSGGITYVLNFKKKKKDIL